MNKLKVGIVGATGYAGIELVRLLLNHSNTELIAVSSVSYEGQNISDIYPNIKEICNMTLENADDIISKCDVIFASLPHGLSEGLAEKCINNNAVFIDLGADFRLHDGEVYKKWYNKEYHNTDLHMKAVYSIPELHRDRVKSANIIGNPGCYPTSIALGLMPSLKYNFIDTNSIIIDAKSGVTGAGRGLAQNTHYPDTNEAFSAYKAGQHRHTPEIEQTLSEISSKDIKVTFVPHLLPVNRGIESTIYCKLNENISVEKIYQTYIDTYKNEKFVRIEPLGNYANIKNVRFSNYCDISIHYDEHTNTLIICSVIDNMVKGAAGQAIQNMNIRFGIDEDMGLRLVPPAF